MPEDSSAVASAALQQPAIDVSARASSASNAPEPAGADLTDAYADLDKSFGVEQETAKPDPKQSKPATTADKKQAAPGKDAAKTGEQSAKDAKGSDGQTTENGKALPAPELRKAYQELKAKHAALEKEYTTFKSTPREHPELKSLQEKLQAAEKHRMSLEDRLKDVAYEQTDEFKRTYHDPFIRSFERGQQLASQFNVTDSEGNIRKGNADDFNALMQFPDEDSATKWAEDTYGPTRAAILMQQRNEVVRHAQSREAARQEAQKMRGEREKTRLESSQAQQRALAEKWGNLNKEAAEKYPDWFSEREGDDAGNKLLQSGYAMADKAFDGSEMSPEEAVKLHSAIRNRSAAFGRTARDLRTAKARIAELEKELEGFKKSEPGPGEGDAETAEPSEMDWERSLEARWKT